MSRGTAAAGVLLVTLSATAAHAQSLADAAAKAEEQRKATGKATKAYTDETLLQREGYETLVADNYLLFQHYDAYSNARLEITSERIGDRTFDERLLKQELAGDRYVLEKAYRSDPKVIEILGKWNISARDYFMADAAFELAGADLQQSRKAPLILLSPSRKANLEFVRENNIYPPYYMHVPWSSAESNLRSYRRMRK